MNLESVLHQFDDAIWDKRIKLARHADGRYELGLIERRGHLREYEARQSRPVFHNADVLFSFMGEGRTLARFVGGFRVVGWAERRDPWPADFPYPDMGRGRFRYELEPLPQFDAIKERLVVDWGSGTRSWVQTLRPKSVIEVRPHGHVGEFPGYDDLIVSFDELRRIVSNPDANRAWHGALRAVAGIYLIVDTQTGNQYVGSAYGEGGILGRWATYVRSPHGGNKKLRALLAEHPERHLSFQFTILRTLPKALTLREVIKVECLQKRRLGTRAFGLNSN